MRIRAYLALALGFGAACGDDVSVMHDAKVFQDAPGKMDAPADAPYPELGFEDNEGGEIRLEWIQNATGKGARGTAFFYKSSTPAKYAPPNFPGCIDARADDSWPLAQGTRTYLDVGQVFIASSGRDLKLNSVCASGCDEAFTTANSKDFLSRTYTDANATNGRWYRKAPDHVTNGGDGDLFLPANELYDVILTGSAEWPATVLKGAAFMPAPFAPISPGLPTATALNIPYDQDFTITYTPQPSTNLPAGWVVNTVIAFTGTPNNGPIIICQEEGTDGEIVVPKQFVNILLANGGGTGGFVRQNLTHHFVELTDSGPKAPGTRKRVDVLTVYCYNQTWSGTAP